MNRPDAQRYEWKNDYELEEAAVFKNARQYSTSFSSQMGKHFALEGFKLMKDQEKSKDEKLARLEHSKNVGNNE